MKFRFPTLVGLLLSSLLAFGQFRNDLSNPLTGFVHRANGSPVADARVELHSAKTGELITSGYTSAQGAFEFSSVSTGAYELIATSGLNETREHIIIPGTNNLTITLAADTQGAESVPGGTTVSVAQYKVPGKARDLLRKAEAAARKQKTDEVNKYLERALEIYPNFAEALTLRGIVKLDSSQVQPAIADLEKAVQCDSNSAMSYLVLGAAYNIAKRFDEALRSSDRGVALLPNAWQGYFEMAKSYIGKADYAHALLQLDKALPLTPNEFAPIHLVKAHALLALRNYRDAMGELQAFLDRAPKNDPNAAQAMAMMDKAKAFIAGDPK